MFLPDIPSGLDNDIFSWDLSSPIDTSTSPVNIKHELPTTNMITNTIPHHKANETTKQPRTLAPGLTRRSHKKSRAGCFTCKTRKIKCGEQKPHCHNCELKSLECKYPNTANTNTNTKTSPRRTTSTSNSSTITTTTTSHTHPRPTKHRSNVTTTTTTTTTIPLPNPSSSPTTFSPLDLRFFHHFLTTAHPHLPLCNTHVWTTLIPSLACTTHPYLLHALLSLGASHLSRLTGVDYRRESLTHRGLALKGLNEALSQDRSSSDGGGGGGGGGDGGGGDGGGGGIKKEGDADAMLATCYALSFQASYMGDGLVDFVTMVRGVAVTTAKVLGEGWKTGFVLGGDRHWEVMRGKVGGMPVVGEGLVEGGMRGLEGVAGEMEMEMEMQMEGVVGETEWAFWEALLGVLEGLRDGGSVEGYRRWGGVYAVWYEIPPDHFQQFLSPDNHAAQLLLAYFVALQLLMVPLAACEWPERSPTDNNNNTTAKARALIGTVEWAENIFERLKNTRGPWKRHLTWPRKVIAVVKKEIEGEMLEEGEEAVLKMRLPVVDIPDCRGQAVWGVAGVWDEALTVSDESVSMWEEGLDPMLVTTMEGLDGPPLHTTVADDWMAPSQMVVDVLDLDVDLI